MEELNLEKIHKRNEEKNKLKLKQQNDEEDAMMKNR